ncbi:ribosomal protein S8e family protein [Actinidia rufa]|uniref:Ribosomal protein S8e family protein n=1 Tax=Actinidia rufa TaxID=165716 RepID=A0A7J0HFM9_9ERIC|nr:ribosomal protein S8e family protein [Actinidia rufa]
MGISRDSMHKRRATGGKKKAWRKKRKYELGRQPANTKLSSNKTVRRVRVRGGNVKWRALRLDTVQSSRSMQLHLSNGIFSTTELTLVERRKPLLLLLPKKEGEEGDAAAEEAKKSNHVMRKLQKRQQERKLDTHVEEQFGGGRLLAAISSRPGQCGRADGGSSRRELELYRSEHSRHLPVNACRDKHGSGWVWNLTCHPILINWILQNSIQSDRESVNDAQIAR